MAYYGATYAVNNKHSFFRDRIFIPTVFIPFLQEQDGYTHIIFETTLGNPDLGQVKSFENTISYNGSIGHIGFSFTYDFS